MEDIHRLQDASVVFECALKMRSCDVYLVSAALGALVGQAFRRHRGYAGRIMGKVTKLNLEEATVRPTRRLHLRDIQDDSPEPRGTTGAQMHAARLALGQDISDVASALRIRRDQIEAIEGGDFDALPGRAYSIGFVRSYAEYLGLDEVEMVAAFKSEFDAAQSAGPELVFPDAEEESRMPRGAFVVVGILVIAALYGVWSLTVRATKACSVCPRPFPAVFPPGRVHR